nr:kirola-like [Ipomoea batatas]
MGVRGKLVGQGVEGQWGTVGSTIIWKFTHGGKIKIWEDVIAAIDDRKKMVKLRVVESDILKSYKKYATTCEVDINRDNFVSWSIEYEKLKEEIPKPLSNVEFILKVTRDTDNHHAKLKP